MAKVREIFRDEIERPINGVIKAGTKDDESLNDELKEYVITTQLKEHFEDFFDRYLYSLKNPTEDIGVWISGFFGSGKSHFLKMLGIILENRKVKEKNAIDYFENKLDDKSLYNDIKKTEANKTISILFNIDESSDQNNRLKKNSIVRTLLKEFNKYCGYTGKFVKLASFERKLDYDGKYDEFKEVYKRVSGEEWVKSRKNVYFVEDDFVETVEEMGLMSEAAARNFLSNDEEEITPKDFAEIIKEYLDKKGNTDSRIVFLLDEVGQYINYESILWLNLQTVSEVLGTTLKGRAWIMVTSQEDMESINSEMKNKHLKDHTSKIQGRFKTTLRLTSENIDEVIKKRLLEKTDAYKKFLEEYYLENEPRIKNTILFAEGTVSFPKYKNERDFSETYPFVPYQFPLLQNVFENIRKLGYSGRHLSRGERSLLNAFQEAAENIINKEIGYIVPFNDFYNSIEKFLDPLIAKTIATASRNDNLTNFDIEVLKVLFMIKDVQGLKASVDNLITLMVTKIDENKAELRKKIEKSLMNLKAEVLIQQNDKEYRFLTDEEQSVSKFINEEMIPPSKINKKISDIVYKEIVLTNTYKSKELGNIYKFNRKLNDEYIGEQNNKVGVNIMTLFRNDDLSALTMKSAGENDVIIKLPEKADYIDEIEIALKIEQYIGKKNISEQTEQVKKIINEKQGEIHDRLQRAKEYITDALLNATYIVKGEILNLKSESPTEKMKKGLEVLLQRIFNKNGYLVSKYTIDSVKRIYEHYNPRTLVETDIYTSNPNKLALKEIKNMIDMYKRMSFNEIFNLFSTSPYGWSGEDIAGLISIMFTHLDIDLKYEGEKLERTDIKTADLLLKKRANDREKLIIEIKKEFDPILIQRAKKVGSEIFRDNSLADTPQELINGLKEAIEIKLNDTNKIKLNYRNKNEYQYPGLSDVEDWQEILESLKEIKDDEIFLQKIASKKEDLLDLREKYEENVKEFFFEDRKKGLFDEGVKTIQEARKYKNIISGIEELENIKNIDEILKMSNPYRRLKDIPIECEKVREHISGNIQEKKSEIEDNIENEKAKLIEEIKDISDKDEIIEQIDIEFEKLVCLLNSSSEFEILNIAYKIDEVKNRIVKGYKEKIRTYIQEIEQDIKNEMNQKEKDNEIENRVRIAFNNLYSELDKANSFNKCIEIKIQGENAKEELLALIDGKEIKRPEIKIDLTRNAPKEIKNFDEADKFVNELGKKIKNELKKGNKVIF